MEEAGFEVRDKRFSTQSVEDAPPKASSQQTERPPSSGSETSPTSHVPFEVTFTSFILSLAASGLVHLGGEADATGKKSVNLAMARQTIDLLSLLQTKTKGNLTAEEDSHLSQTLYALRMAFVELDKKR